VIYCIRNKGLREAVIRSPAVHTIIVFFIILFLSPVGNQPDFQQAALLQAQELSQSGARLSRGMFLVASRQLIDPNFSETVVLLVEYSTEGAVGLIINRPTDIRLSKILTDIRELRRRRDTVYVGGPVGRDQLLLLIKSGSKPDESYHVFKDVYICSDIDALRRITSGKNDAGDFRAYAGYSGWAPGQLEFEMTRGDWHLFPADMKSVFSKDPSEVYPRLIERSTAQWTKNSRDGTEESAFDIGMTPHKEENGDRKMPARY
jgi:putative transcriptional regulator